MVNGKYTFKVRTAIDEYWRVNHHPPTIRDLMSMCDLPSTSHTRYIVRSFGDVRLAKHGRIIPEWVDKLFPIARKKRGKMLEIQLEGEDLSPRSLVGKWFTDDLFKASGADQIKIIAGGQTVLLVYNHPANNSEAWQDYVADMAKKGWAWFATWSYMAFKSAQQTLAVDASQDGSQSDDGSGSRH